MKKLYINVLFQLEMLVESNGCLFNSLLQLLFDQNTFCRNESTDMHVHAHICLCVCRQAANRKHPAVNKEKEKRCQEGKFSQTHLMLQKSAANHTNVRCFHVRCIIRRRKEQCGVGVRSCRKTLRTNCKHERLNTSSCRVQVEGKKRMASSYQQIVFHMSIHTGNMIAITHTNTHKQ